MVSQDQKTWDGMYHQHACSECGKLLNQNGTNPVELRAGTYTGLCRSCEQRRPFVIEEFLDGGKRVSHPPDCPSYRRDRERHVWYADCRHCSMGSFLYSRAIYAGSYRAYCPWCMARYRVYTQERRQRKLQGLSPFEVLAAAFQTEGQLSAREAQKSTTKIRTSERKSFFAGIAADYEQLAQQIIAYVFHDAEEELLAFLDHRFQEVQRHLSTDPTCCSFFDERVALMCTTLNDLHNAFPAQCAFKKRQTRVLM